MARDCRGAPFVRASSKYPVNPKTWCVPSTSIGQEFTIFFILKLVADPDDDRLLGAHIIGDGATELIHLAQMAMLESLTTEVFVENIFNFATTAEAYRVAALDLARNASQAGLHAA